MCGIAGFVNFPDGLQLAQQAGRLQAHRGPDHQGTWQLDNVALSHQRLSIIDLSPRSNQPLVKGNLVVIFNGEIYNYKELREELEGTFRVHFETSGDTEVVLEAFRHLGLSFLNKLAGMFAFAIYDISKASLLLARDPFGIKPLFIFQQGQRVAFASELKTLVAVPGFQRTLNMDALVSAANFLWIPGNICMFTAVSKLPAGNYCVIDCKASPVLIESKTYMEWRPQTETYSEAEWTDRLRQCMEASVRRHMVADVPVSSFLSGGLDSSLISVMALKHAGSLSTFTIGMLNKDKKIESMPDDQRYAEALALQFRLDHTTIPVTSGIVDLLPSMVRILDEPIGDPAAINTYLICKAARERGVKVLLSGMGADELFFGYRRQRATLMAARYSHLPAPIRFAVKASLGILPVKMGARGFRWVRWGKRFISLAEQPLETSYRRSYSYYDQADLSNLFSADVRGEINSLQKAHAEVFNSWPPDDAINQICHTDIEYFMQGLNLTYTDRASMAASVEVRVPFIDREVVQLAMNLPGAFKFKKGEGKYLLKKVAEAYLPKKFIYRPKASFGAPIRSWISSDLRPWVDQYLSEEVVKRRGLFNYTTVRKMIDEDRKGTNDFAYPLYWLLTTELWMREFVDRH